MLGGAKVGLFSKERSARSRGADGAGKAGQSKASRAGPGMVAWACQQAVSPDLSVG